MFNDNVKIVTIPRALCNSVVCHYTNGVLSNKFMFTALSKFVIEASFNSNSMEQGKIEAN